MKQRIITSVVLFAVALPILIFSKYIVFQAALAFLSVVAVYEMLGVLGVRSVYFLSVPSYILAVAMPLSSYFANDGRHLSYIILIILAVFVYMLYTFAVAVFKRGALSVGDSASCFMLVSYIAVSFSALGLLRVVPGGELLFELVFLAAWVTDIFAYFTGYFLGKHKLIPEVSPKKTVEGAIGGIVFSIIGFMLYGLVIDLVTDYSVRYLILAVMGLVLSVVSQIGDLTASLVKREHGVKDYGFIFPGHGGVMDRFDSIIAVSMPLFVLTVIAAPFVMA